MADRLHLNEGDSGHYEESFLASLTCSPDPGWSRRRVVFQVWARSVLGTGQRDAHHCKACRPIF